MSGFIAFLLANIKLSEPLDGESATGAPQILRRAFSEKVFSELDSDNEDGQTALALYCWLFYNIINAKTATAYK